jgi:hypothetical protein
MNAAFVLAAAYKWPDKEKKETTTHSEAAVRHIARMISNRFNGKKSEVGISYKRLRASAGKTMLDSIVKRIETSQVILFDISENNPNVFLELGIAIALTRASNHISLYLIREKKEHQKLPHNLPSDLQGYFISEYTVNTKGDVVFHDNNSLRMSIESDVKEYMKKSKEIDEINHNN